MEPTATAELTVLQLAADALDALVQPIISRWLERVGSTIYATHPELSREDLLDNTPPSRPWRGRGLAQALRSA